jgi:hypothetical protein
MFEIDVDEAKIIPGPDGNVRIEIADFSNADAKKLLKEMLNKKHLSIENILDISRKSSGKALELIEYIVENHDCYTIFDVMLASVDFDIVQKALDRFRPKKK